MGGRYPRIITCDLAGWTASNAPGMTEKFTEEKPMRTWRGLGIVGVGLLLLGLTGQVALAQQPAAPVPDPAKAEAMAEIQFTRAELSSARQALVTQAMDLTPEEMQGFWPLYRDYRREATKVGDRIVALIAAYADNYDNLTDPAADKLLAEFVGIEKARASLKAKYLPKFKKVLPTRKVARFYQLENKLDVLILAEMAEQIPLAR
jgi:hypothetical protein